MVFINYSICLKYEKSEKIVQPLSLDIVLVCIFKGSTPAQFGGGKENLTKLFKDYLQE